MTAKRLRAFQEEKFWFCLSRLVTYVVTDGSFINSLLIKGLVVNYSASEAMTNSVDTDISSDQFPFKRPEVITRMGGWTTANIPVVPVRQYKNSS